MTITLNTENLQTGSAASAKLAGVRSTEAKSDAEEAVQSAPRSRKFDTVELSDEAESYLSGTAEAGSTAETSAVQTAAAETSTESVSSTELYSYTDTQLSELLSKGEITQLQDNTEMAKRTSAE